MLNFFRSKSSVPPPDRTVVNDLPLPTANQDSLSTLSTSSLLSLAKASLPLHPTLTANHNQEMSTPQAESKKVQDGGNTEVNQMTAESSAQTRVVQSIESDTAPRVGLRKYLPSGEVPEYYRLRHTDRSSAPPGTLGDLRDKEQFRRLNYLDRYALDILPPPTMPVYLQILTYVQRFATWCATIDNKERYAKTTQFFGEKMESVWVEGMRQGLIPAKWTEDPAIASRVGDDIVTVEDQKNKRKRPTDPRRALVIDTRRDRHSTGNGITVGELEEAGIDFEKVKLRVEADDFEDGDFLMEEVLEQINRMQIKKEDWFLLQQRTPYNHMGRDLQIYCLWEVQNSRAEIAKLETLKLNFTTNQQIRNTENRIVAEQSRLNYCMALALEIREGDIRDEPSGTVDEDRDGNDQVDGDEDVMDGPSDPADEVAGRSDRDDGSERLESHEQNMPDVSLETPLMTQELINSQEDDQPTAFVEDEGQASNTIKKIMNLSGLVTPPVTPQKQGLKRTVAEADTEGIVAKRLKRSNDDDDENHEQQSVTEVVVDDVAGYPSKADILRALPRTGWAPQDIKQFHKPDQTFISLVKSVAYFDKERKLWLPKAPQSSALNLDGAIPMPNGHHAMVVRLPYTEVIKAENHSVRQVHNTNGFRWRYYTGTTTTERIAMKPHVEEYVSQMIERDRYTARTPTFNPLRRQGQYELLVNPEDPDRKTIVHGIWDETKDTPVRDQGWFYNGEDGEWISKAFQAAEGEPSEENTNDTIKPLKFKINQIDDGQAGPSTQHSKQSASKRSSVQVRVPSSSTTDKKNKGKKKGRRRHEIDTKPKTMLEERSGRTRRAAALNRPTYALAEFFDDDEEYTP